VERQSLHSLGNRSGRTLLALRDLLRAHEMRLGDPALVLLGMSFFATVFSTVRIVVGAVTRKSQRTSRPNEIGVSAVSDERIARIEAAVEAIAIEVERISEGQRFTTRLLSEQKQPAQVRLPSPGKFDTPH
jgi:hypothetical protein